MGSQAAGSEGQASGPPLPVAAPLIGNLGQEYVQTTLSTNDPVTAIADIQTRGAIKDPRCQPLIGLLDQLGLSRSESHQFVVQRAVETLLAKIPKIPPERLRHLLDETFPYIGIRELKAIPLAILDCLRPVPATFLKLLAQDKELFWELPLGVQQQAWEVDRKLLHSHALPLIAAYTYETATWMEGLNMGDDIDARGSAVPHLARRNLRRGSAALSRLVSMVGKSPVIYKGIIELCTARFRDVDSIYIGMKDAALCALRSQLLMSLHDSGQTGICAGDPCHKLAWTLDACMRDGVIDARRLKELKNFFSKYSVSTLPFVDRRLKKPSKHLAKRKRTRRKVRNALDAGADVYFDLDRADTDGSVVSGVSGLSSAAAAGVSFWEQDAESTGLPGSSVAEDPLRELGAAAMVIRDPSALNLILRQIIRCLERCVAEQLVPKSDQELLFLTQLLSLGVEAREMLQSNVYRMSSPHGEIVGTLYPIIADLIIDAELASELASEAPAPEELVNMMVRSEISRRVVQMFVLRRLQAKDLLSSCRVLISIVSLTNDFAKLAYCYYF